MTSATNLTARPRFSRRPHGAGLVAAAAGAAALLAACSSGGSTAPAAGGAARSGGSGTTTLSTSQVPGAGTVLTDQSGLTVYEAQQEAGGKILCTGGCLSFWMPVTLGHGATPSAASGISGKLGTIGRPDGGTQLTVNGHPLYTFKQDSGPGSDTGNNFADSFGSHSFTWHALTAAGAAVPAAGGNSSSTPAGNSYGY